MQTHKLKPDDITSVTAHVHQGAIDVLGPVTDPRTIHQSKFSMGFVLALIANIGRASLADFTDSALVDPKLRVFHDKVKMALDPAVDQAYPKRWLGHVSVTTRDGRTLDQRIESPKGDPDNALTRDELEDKAMRLGAFAGGATVTGMRQIIARAWRLHDEPRRAELRSSMTQQTTTLVDRLTTYSRQPQIRGSARRRHPSGQASHHRLAGLCARRLCK
jgi:2-methylcitrate dehydratase PrpD